MTEPMTLLTDYLLGGLSFRFASRLVRSPEVAGAAGVNHASGTSCVAVRLWGFALAGVAAAAFAGGTYHGFARELGALTAGILWKLTTISMGVASFFLLASTFTASFRPPVRTWLVAAAVVKLAVYVVWMLGHDDFAYVIYEYGSTLMVVFALSAAGCVQGSRGHRWRIIGGIAVSIAAALLQQSGVRVHRHFNHNDLMHVVQMAGVWLLYQGGARLRDAATGELHAGKS